MLSTQLLLSLLVVPLNHRVELSVFPLHRISCRAVVGVVSSSDEQARSQCCIVVRAVAVVVVVSRCSAAGVRFVCASIPGARLEQ